MQRTSIVKCLRNFWKHKNTNIKDKKYKWQFAKFLLSKIIRKRLLCVLYLEFLDCTSVKYTKFLFKGVSIITSSL